MLVRIDAHRIVDKQSFHAVFAEAFGFLKSYGRNMDAWIDCMSSLDVDDGMTAVHVKPGQVAVIHLDAGYDFTERCPDLYRELVECSAFVNGRQIASGKDPLLAVSVGA